MEYADDLCELEACIISFFEIMRFRYGRFKRRTFKVKRSTRVFPTDRNCNQTMSPTNPVSKPGGASGWVATFPTQPFERRCAVDADKLKFGA